MSQPQHVDSVKQNETNSDDEIWNFLIECLYEGETRVLFEKADGTMREMICTLNEQLIDYEFGESKPLEAVTPIAERTSLTVWDTENEGWRKLTKGKIDTVDSLVSDTDFEDGDDESED